MKIDITFVCPFCGHNMEAAQRCLYPLAFIVFPCVCGGLDYIKYNKKKKNERIRKANIPRHPVFGDHLIDGR
uniref:Uncharacterized protein n=1 Tax=viral metagenome TaxID=1070528 RepID=A0A6M3JKD2_9ZZZZ